MNTVVVGSSMVDIYGKSFNRLLMYESNPGRSHISCGGVGRNISENLVNLGLDFEFITCFGNDYFGEYVYNDCLKKKINVSNSYFSKDLAQSTYSSIVDSDGSMKLALSNVEVLESMSISFIKEKEDIISKADILVVDTGINKDVLSYLIEKYSDKKIVLDPVSIGLSYKIKHLLKNIHTLKCNRNEAEYLSDISIDDKESLIDAGKYLISLGLKQCFITLGKDGVFYINNDKHGILGAKKVEVINESGAGDSFCAGVIYCLSNDKDIEYTAKFSSMMSYFTLYSQSAVSDKISVEKIIKSLKE